MSYIVNHKIIMVSLFFFANIGAVSVNQSVEPVEQDSHLISKQYEDAGTDQESLHNSPLPPTELDATETKKSDSDAATELLNEFIQDGQHFYEQAKDLRKEAKRFIQEEYEQREKLLNDIFEKKIHEHEKNQRDVREAAIVKFENFLKKYPDQERYTPDAMFRLSELYYERSYDEYLQANDAFEKALAEGKGANMIAPAKHYEPTIALMQQLITNFPNFRLIDGCYYLLAYCLGDQMEDERAVSIYEELVRKYPNSRFVPEVWTRIGEYYFENDELEKALTAYQKVMRYPENQIYDKALYKLAWTHYRMADPETSPEHFEKAVEAFTQLVDFAESQKKQGERRGQELRPEAIQYIAISFAEEKWGSLQRAQNFYKKVNGRDYEREVYSALGNVYFDQTRYDLAIEVYQFIQENYPDHEEAPIIQDQLVKAFEKKRDFAGATKAREVLVKNFSEGSQWFTINKDNTKALENAADLTKSSLLSSAQFHHSQAQTFKNSEQIELAKTEYGIAADSYGEYLKRFPHDHKLYELKFYYAECMYYSLQYLEAAQNYTWVRDSRMDKKYKEPAAISTVLSYENQLKLEELTGKREPLKILKSTDREKGQKIEPKPIDDLHQKLIDASDVYVETVPTGESVPNVMYKSAEILFSYDYLPQSRERFEKIVETYPDHEVAEFAANLIIEGYLIQENWKEVEHWSTLLAQKPMKSASKEFRKNLKKFKAGAVFMTAVELDANSDYEKAADQYLRLVNEMSGNEFEDRALNNAAIAFEKSRRFDSATKLYERLAQEHPKSPLADNAVFRVGLNSERFFDFDKAVSAYLSLVKNYPKSPKRADALYNAAFALENTQQYEKAVAAYQRYCKIFRSREDAPEVCYRAGAVYEKIGDSKKALKTYSDFVKRFGRKKEHAEQVVAAQLKIAKSYEKLKKKKQAITAYKKVLKTFNRHKEEKAAGFAAEAQFRLINEEYKTYEKIKIAGKSKNQAKILVKKSKMLKDLETKYNNVLNFKHITWNLAALLRVGMLYQNMAFALINVECPPDVRRLARRAGLPPEEVCLEYKIPLQDQAIIPEEKAIQAYLLTLERAKEFKVVNEYTKEAQLKLNFLRPKEYPLEKEPKTIRFFDSYIGSSSIPGPQITMEQESSKQEEELSHEQTEAASPTGEQQQNNPAVDEASANASSQTAVQETPRQQTSPQPSPVPPTTPSEAETTPSDNQKPVQ